ncbi:MAG: FAD-binding oxidoreductase [Actinomycetota bacterium]|nr:FAD-binding oxidoreductase [Actinomycetota bacterium]
MAGGPSWERVSRYDRLAVVLDVDQLTSTGTVKITLQAIDDRPFLFSPGHWVGIEEEVPGLGLRRSPYCVMSGPSADRGFAILIRVFPEGPLAHHLASLQSGDLVHFRGPAGRSMLPKDAATDLVLVATGVGVSPLHALCCDLLARRDGRDIRLYWGLRSPADICLVDDLNALADHHPNFSYQISLSQPPSGWPQLRGRVTESVPPLLDKLRGKFFVLSGNGAMVEEMEVALTSVGVDRTSIHSERFFNIRHRPDPATVNAIVARFSAADRQASNTNLDDLESIFRLQRDIHGRPTGHPH